MYKTAAAARRREEGNAAFGRGAYEDAYRLYSQSLESAEDYRTYANRAATLLKQGAAAYAAQLEGFDMITPEIDRIYRAATGDAGRAATLQPSFAKAWYRQAKAQVGSRDLPRARMTLERGLRTCPGNTALKTLRDAIVALGIDKEEVRIANPLAGGSQAAWARVQAGAPCVTCPFCVQPVPQDQLGSPCPHCAADAARAGVDQAAIHEMIRAC